MQFLTEKKIPAHGIFFVRGDFRLSKKVATAAFFDSLNMERIKPFHVFYIESNTINPRPPVRFLPRMR